MKSIRILFAAVLVSTFLLPSVLTAADQPSGKIRVLVVTGGHDFEREPFMKLFKDNPDITFKAVEHPNAHSWLKPEAAKELDVLVLYDMWQNISAETKADFLAYLQAGKGLVVLHHAIANYQKWPEYSKIVGARYYLEKTVVDGVEKARSAYQHDVNFKIKVADPQHPVTKGVTDFEIHDETYKLFDVFDECHALLTTDEPLSNKVIAWAKTYGPARVVYMQSGHDHFAYENPQFQRLLKQAITWVGKQN